MLCVDLLAQLVATAEPFPGQELAETRAERHCGEERERRVLAGVIARRRPARFDRALGHRVEALERRDQGAGLEELHFELTSRHAFNVFGKAHPGSAKMRELTGEGTLHFPANALLCMSIGYSRCEAESDYVQC